MVDIIPTVADLLSEICPVELQFPNKSAEFPLITICEIANQSDTVLDGTERLSVISVQADVWDNSKTPARAADRPYGAARRTAQQRAFRCCWSGSKKR